MIWDNLILILQQKYSKRVSKGLQFCNFRAMRSATEHDRELRRDVISEQRHSF